jgi:O-antigen/teichoic acid export membrane protein
MPWVAIATIVSSIRTYYTDIPFYLSKRTNLHAVMVMGVAAANVILNFVFIPKYGIVGAVYASIIVHMSALALSFVFANSMLRFVVPYLDLLKLVVAIFGCSALTIVMGKAFVSKPIVSIVLSGFLYMLLIWIMDVASVRTHTAEFLHRKTVA